MTPIITLTTDFGTKDPYVAAMKGVILRINPDIKIVDLTHEISPHNIMEANLFLANSCPYFPDGTIHVVVIDPGVGTEREPIVVSTCDQVFACPDNGLLTLISKKLQIKEARVIKNKTFMLEHVSSTFHGRDIFAPVAAYLASGRKIENVGDKLDKIEMIDIPEPVIGKGRVTGEIIHIDRFGNLISNISLNLFEKSKNYEILIKDKRLDKISQAYGEKNKNELLAIIGSSDLLEISVNQGSAENVLGVVIGEKISVKFNSN